MKSNWRKIVFLLGVILAVVLLLDLSNRMEQLDRLATQLDVVASEATAVMETQVGLMTQVAYATSDAAVEQWAYEDGKWVRDGENLVEIVPEGQAEATPEPTVEVTATKQPHWRVWWELFFGDKP
jgi:hypothetical protein